MERKRFLATLGGGAAATALGGVPARAADAVVFAGHVFVHAAPTRRSGATPTAASSSRSTS